MSDAAAYFNQDTRHGLAKHLGIVAEEIRSGYVRMRMTVAPQLMAGNGFLHAGSLVTLADTASGVGCMHSYPTGVENFTTIELKTNFLGACRQGDVLATATLIHGGRSTQVWDCSVRDVQRDRVVAEFRCTQMLLYPRG